MKRSLLCLTLLLATMAHAKLPAPPPTEEAKAKAAEAAARTAWASKVDAYKLCKSQDRAASHYFKTAAAAGKSVKPAVAGAACTDPGVFAYTPPKPIEASGAHSPSETAKSPPSTNAPASVTMPAKK